MGVAGPMGSPGKAGPPGIPGTSGKSPLVSVTVEPPGPNCPAGGQAFSTGVDENGNEILDPDEITQSWYLCNEPTGNLWSPTGAPGSRYLHGAARLADGSVLIAGGLDAHGNALRSAQLWTPNTGVWRDAPDMSSPRQWPIVLGLPSGILVAGGYSGASPVGSAEIFDGASWQDEGSMTTARYQAGVSLLGAAVIISGGYGVAGVLGTAEKFDGAWSAAGTMSTPRYGHASVSLGDRVMVMGGYDTNGAAQATAEICDGTSWRASASMKTARAQASAVALPDGRVLVMGGRNGTSFFSSAEIYDPVLDKWSDAGTMAVSRSEEVDPQEVPLEHREIFMAAAAEVFEADGEIHPQERMTFQLLDQLLR
jgi:hypothetical protein